MAIDQEATTLAAEKGSQTLRLAQPPQPRGGTALTARAIKIVLVLDPAAVEQTLRPLAIADRRVPIAVDVEGRRLTAEFAPKAVRKVLSVLAEHGADGVAVLIQGRLMADNSIADAGLVAQPKAPKPA